MGNVGDEAEDEQDVEPPADLEMGGHGRRVEPEAVMPRASQAPEEGQAVGSGMMGDGERLEIEIAEGDQDQGGVDDRRIGPCRGIGGRAEEEAADDEIDGADQHQQAEQVDGKGESQPEARPAEQEEAVKKPSRVWLTVKVSKVSAP